MRRTIVALVTVAGVATFSIAPTQHDFGPVGVLGIRVLPFHVTMATGATSQDSIFMSFAGADAGDFAVVESVVGHADRPCYIPDPRYPRDFIIGRPGACDVEVEFRPHSIGPKTARLEVRDRRGTTLTALLKGIGVAPLCEVKLVPCNYAHLYSGTFHWQSGLFGEYGSNRLNVTVNVVNGVATCDGVQLDEIVSVQGANRYTTASAGTISGKGLIAVEFLVDSANAPVYRVTAACPSPQWPPALNRPVQQAEFGKTYFEQSYDVASPGTGENLVGSRSEPHPDADNTNGVSGTIVVTWHLKRS